MNSVENEVLDLVNERDEVVGREIRSDVPVYTAGLDRALDEN